MRKKPTDAAAKFLYLAKRTHPDILQSIPFLSSYLRISLRISQYDSEEGEIIC